IHALAEGVQVREARSRGEVPEAEWLVENADPERRHRAAVREGLLVVAAVGIEQVADTEAAFDGNAQIWPGSAAVEEGEALDVEDERGTSGDGIAGEGGGGAEAEPDAEPISEGASEPEREVVAKFEAGALSI